LGTCAGVDRRGHFQSVGDITTQQIFGLKRGNGIDADEMHVPLMAVPHDQDHTSTGSDSDPDIWNADEPDAAMLDSWASLGFSASLYAPMLACSTFAEWTELKVIVADAKGMRLWFWMMRCYEVISYH
jgi:hypothetical protein